jgi:hypothetical protein
VAYVDALCSKSLLGYVHDGEESVDNCSCSWSMIILVYLVLVLLDIKNARITFSIMVWAVDVCRQLLWLSLVLPLPFGITIITTRAVCNPGCGY